MKRRHWWLLSGGAALVVLALIAFVVVEPAMRTAKRGAGFTVAAPGETTDLTAFNRQIAEVSDQGGTWVRFGAPAVWTVEQWGVGDEMVLDETSLDTIDKAIDNARDAGLQVYFITTDSYNDDSDRDRYRDIMSSYWSALASRFADRVDVWQVYNEPNGRDYVNFDADVETDAEYLRKLASDIGLARDTIRESNPDVLVTTNAGGFPMDEALETEWQELFDTLGDSVDAVSVGVYPQMSETAIAELPEELTFLRERYDKPVIVGEVGLQTCATCQISEADQGTYVAKTVDSIAKADVMATLVYELQDRGTDGEGTFGALRIDGAPKDGADKIFAAVENY